MARWRVKTARVEPPGWYRVFDPAAWDEPDLEEWRMLRGWWWEPWPEHLHRQHVQRRWQAAKHAYRQAHPDLAEQEFNELLSRNAARWTS